ncbi:hypothetical protein D3C85_989480 [compost metagenome]
MVPTLEAFAIIVSLSKKVEVDEEAFKLNTVAFGVKMVTFLMLPPVVPSKRVPDVLEIMSSLASRPCM